ncbi:MAG: hypothetical protein V4628_13665 [Pseudomonadota bacterium]
MSALKKLRLWLQQRMRPAESGPDGRDLLLPDKFRSGTDFNQGQFHNDVKKQLDIASRESRVQQNWRSRAGPWQQK